MSSLPSSYGQRLTFLLAHKTCANEIYPQYLYPLLSWPLSRTPLRFQVAGG